MPVHITYLGHSGFLFSDGRYVCAVDPFLTGNPVAKHKPEQIRCDYVAITHGHDDHVGDSLAIAQHNDATLVACYEICAYLGEKGQKKSEPGNTGGKIVTDFGWIAFTQAFHSSSSAGRYLGQPSGLVIHIGGITIYHAGDTGLFSDMKLIGEVYRPMIACLPVGDRFTMGPELATRAAEMIRPQYAIPMHYKTFGMLRSTCSGFTPTGVTVKELAPGESWAAPAGTSAAG